MFQCECFRWFFSSGVNYYELDDSPGILDRRIFGFQRTSAPLELSDPYNVTTGPDAGVPVAEPGSYSRRDLLESGGQVVAEKVIRALSGEPDLGLDKGKVTSNSVKLVVDRFSTSDLRAICQKIRECKRIVSVEFGGNEFRDFEVVVLAENLKYSHIEHLSIVNNSVSDVGLSYIGQLVRSCPLVSLSLANNEITDAAMTQFAEDVVQCPSLRYLDLSSNAWITDDGMEQLVTVLRGNPSICLQSLNVGNASIGDLGCRSLAGWLSSQGCPLVKLNLQHNVVEDQGAEDLAVVLENSASTTLEELNLAGNMLSKKGVVHLERAIQKHPTLRVCMSAF